MTTGRIEPDHLRVVVVDDERPARRFLIAALRTLPSVDVVGEAGGASDAIALIESVRPDLAFLDLQMPEVDGLALVRLIRPAVLPLVAFVTAHDAYAVQAFELNAVDYLLKPVDAPRLHAALERARERLEMRDWRDQQAQRLQAAALACDVGTRSPYLQRIPIRQQEDIVLVPVDELVSAVADGEVLHLTTTRGEQYTLTYRLKDLAAKLDPDRFVRLGRGTLASLAMIRRVHPMPGGTYVVTLANGDRLPVSRIQGRVLRERVLRL